jgi:hypothetical protein
MGHFFFHRCFFIILLLKFTKSNQWISELPRSTSPLKQENITLCFSKHVLLNIGPINIYAKLLLSYISNAALATFLLGFII